MIKLKNIILHPFFLTFCITLVIIVLLPPIFNKYEVITIEKGSVPSSIDYFRCFHFDLDNNGYSEQVRSFYSSAKNHAIQVFKHDGGIIDQWNFDGMPTDNDKSDRLVTGDYDKDGLSEIYVFCKLGDTIMLNCIEPGDTLSELNFRNKKLFILSHEYGTPDCFIQYPVFTDMNNDNYGDILFNTHSGFAIFPRNVYIIDLHNDTVISSPKIGAGLGSLYIADFDHDNKPEITGSTCAAGNVHDSLKIPYNDYSA